MSKDTYFVIRVTADGAYLRSYSKKKLLLCGALRKEDGDRIGEMRNALHNHYLGEKSDETFNR